MGSFFSRGNVFYGNNRNILRQLTNKLFEWGGITLSCVFFLCSCPWLSTTLTHAKCFKSSPMVFTYGNQRFSRFLPSVYICWRLILGDNHFTIIYACAQSILLNGVHNLTFLYIHLNSWARFTCDGVYSPFSVYTRKHISGSRVYTLWCVPSRPW